MFAYYCQPCCSFIHKILYFNAYFCKVISGIDYSKQNKVYNKKYFDYG